MSDQNRHDTPSGRPMGGIGSNQYTVRGVPKRKAQRRAPNPFPNLSILGHDALFGQLTAPRCDEEVFDAIANLGEVPHDVVIRMAGHIDCPPDILRGLGGYNDYRIKEAVANNLRCPLTMLRQLTGDRSERVRLAAASNPNCPVDAIVRLLRDDDSNVREHAAQQLADNVGMYTPDETKMFSDASPEYRAALGK